MSNVRAFKRIEPAEDETVNLQVPAPIVSKLDTLAQELTTSLGFDVTISDAIGWLVRQHEGRNVSPEEKAAREAERAAKLKVRDMDIAVKSLMPGQKINAIKLVRERTGLGLKEAKDYVEARDWTTWEPEKV